MRPKSACVRDLSAEDASPGDGAQLRREPAALKTPAHFGLATVPALASVAVVGLAVEWGGGFAPTLFGMSPIGVGLSYGAWTYLRDPERDRMAWRIEHLVNMLAAGIAVHTAFAVFFLGQLLEVRLPGALAILPWILPTVIGVPAIVLWARHERLRLTR